MLRVERLAAFVDSTGSFMPGTRPPLVVSADGGEANVQLEEDCSARRFDGRTLPAQLDPGLYHFVVTDPAGNSGSRIACGVLNAVVIPLTPAGMPKTGEQEANGLYVGLAVAVVILGGEVMQEACPTLRPRFERVAKVGSETDDARSLG